MSEAPPVHTPESWSAATSGYAHVAAQMMEPFAEALLERLEPSAEHAALEVACGTGALTVHLKVARELDVPSIDAVWALMTSGAPPVQVLLDKVGPDGAARMRHHLGKILSERFGDGPIRMRNVATIGVGTAS